MLEERGHYGGEPNKQIVIAFTVVAGACVGIAPVLSYELMYCCI